MAFSPQVPETAKNYYLINKTKGTLVHERGYRLLDGVEVIT